MRNEDLYDRGQLVRYPQGDRSLHRTPLRYLTSISDKYHMIAEEETLLTISYKYYGTQKLWYILADINVEIIEDIFDLPVGETIVIPNLDILDSIYG